MIRGFAAAASGSSQHPVGHASQRAQMPGDALYLDFTGLAAAERLGVRLNATGVNNPADPVFNVWNIPGNSRVNYKQIEKMNHVQTVAVGTDVGGQEPR